MEGKLVSTQGIPLERSKRELAAAKAAFQGMGAAASLEEFAVAWQGFLDRLEKVWVKAERECQPFRARFEPWQARFKDLRKKDELLRYLLQARHADQHTIQSTTQELLGQLELVIPPLGTVEMRLDEEKGQLHVSGECSIRLTRGRGYLLLPVENRGLIFPAPTIHLGEKLPRNDALLVAEKGLAFYEAFLEQVEATFFPSAA